MLKRKRKRRLDKKIHKRMLDYCVIDLSQVSFWRRRLFDSEFGEPFPIDPEHVQGIPERIAKVIQKDNLHFLVAKVPAEEIEWMGEGLIVFKFWARDYPSIRMYSWNNPEAR